MTYQETDNVTTLPLGSTPDTFIWGNPWPRKRTSSPIIRPKKNSRSWLPEAEWWINKQSNLDAWSMVSLVRFVSSVSRILTYEIAWSQTSTWHSPEAMATENTRKKSFVSFPLPETIVHVVCEIPNVLCVFHPLPQLLQPHTDTAIRNDEILT